MKTKKNIIQICLMLACILLQAHVILPHFHHDGIVCITKETSTDCLRCHSAQDHKHAKNHCSQNLDACDIKQIVIRQNDLNDDLDTTNPVNLLSLYCLVYPLSNLYLEFPDSTTERNQIPYTDTYTSPFTGSIKSLRAPPSFLG